MTAYCVDTSGSTSSEQALAAVAWIRGRMGPKDVVVVFAYGAEVTTLEEIEEAFSKNPADFRKYGNKAWFGGTDVKALMALLKELGQESAYVITDGYFVQKDLTVGKMVDIARLPEVHEPPRM